MEEGPSEDDIARFSDEAMTCPECGSEVYHDSPLCQTCGHAFTNESIFGRKQAWVAGTAVIALIAFGALIIF